MAVRRRARRIALVMIGLASTVWAQAPSQGSRSFTLQQAIEYADQHYPSVRAAVERVRGAQGQIDLARTNYLPGTSLLWQSNRATANNIYGLLLPQGVIPPISGPVLPTTSGRSVWGSAGGVLFSWEPFDFGYRRAVVNVARSGERIARSQADLTHLDVEAAAAEACLTLLASEQAARAAQANVSRWEVFDKSVRVLVDNELRPGADASRADAELAVARTQLIQAQTAEKSGRAALADILGIAGTAVEVDPGQILTSLPLEDIPAVSAAAHPAAATEHARVEQFKAQKEALDRSYVPRFFTQASVSGRGSGANPNGTDASGLNGLGLERANYAAGITVNFPVFDYFSNRAEKKIVDANQRAEAARYDQTLQDLSDQAEQARAALEGARRVAENTPVELAAARASESQARARYQSGLTTVVEVAESEGLLVQAEIDDALARLNVWRALAGVAAAQGNLQPFVELLGKRKP
ncbi:MAG TPA: TolC family protein [Terriglobia bacterium]|nr:TolC family protein [Terriglobia bacterium]